MENSLYGNLDRLISLGESAEDALDFVLELADSMGFKTKNIDNVIGYAEYGKGDEMVAVLGHLDVVPAGDGWETEPFRLVEKDGALYGRGVMDNKGPMMTCLYALNEIKDEGIEPDRRIRLIFGTDEETGCHDVERYLETEEIPVAAFTPDAEFPVIFSEKNLAVFNISAELQTAEDCDSMFRLEEADAGDVPNKVPSRARILLGGKVFETEEGISAHGSRPELGVNAIDIVMREIADSVMRESMPEGFRKFFDFYMCYIYRDISGEKLGVNVSCPETGQTSLNAGVLRLLEEEGVIRLNLAIDFRTPASQDQGPLLDKIKDICRDKGVGFSLEHAKYGLYISRDSQLVRKLSRIYDEETGLDPSPVAIGGGTYAKKLPNTVAFGPLMPGRKDTIHQANECFNIEDFELCRKIYKRSMLDISRTL